MPCRIDLRPGCPIETTASRASEPLFPALTGLRGVAAVLVAAMHLWYFAGQPRWQLGPIDLTPLVFCGYFGVDLFFVLSGFLLGLPFLQARMGQRPPPRLSTFWIRRARRVLPALWVQLAVLFVLGWIVTGVAPLSLWELLGQASLTFNLVDGARSLNPVYWSLPVEWDFYVVLPLLALLFARGSGRPWGLPLVLAAVLAFRVACVWAGQQWGADAIPFARWIIQLPARLDQFVLGMVAAWWVLHAPLPPRAGPALAWSGLLLALGLMWHAAPLGDLVANLTTPEIYWHYSALGLAFALLIAGSAQGAGRVLDAVLCSRPLQHLGLISYSLYLWHYPVLEALRALRWLEGPHAWLWWPAATVACVAVAWLSWRWIEKPFQAAPRGGLTDPRSGIPAACAAPPRS